MAFAKGFKGIINVRTLILCPVIELSKIMISELGGYLGPH
jgi:hypothetical protein